MDKIVTLKNMYDTIGEYLKKYGDKEVLSIATWGGGTKNAYSLRLSDIGSNSMIETDTLTIERK